MQAMITTLADIRAMTDPLGRDCTPRKTSARASCGHQRLQTPDAGCKSMARAGNSEMSSAKDAPPPWFMPDLYQPARSCPR
jgi:hypothetical protein